MRTLALPLLLVLAAAGARAQAGATLRDDSTGVRFDVTTTVGGTTYRCLGAGARKVFLFKAYAVAYCLEEAKVDEVIAPYLRERHPGKKGEALAEALEEDQRFYDRLAGAPGDKLVVMRVVRDISRDRIAGAFEDSLSDVLPKEKVAKLIATIPGDAQDGQQILIHSHGSRVVIDIAGKAKNIDDAMIAQKLWRVWLGPSGVSPSLKESIAEEVARRAG